MSAFDYIMYYYRHRRHARSRCHSSNGLLFIKHVRSRVLCCMYLNTYIIGLHHGEKALLTVLLIDTMKNGVE